MTQDEADAIARAELAEASCEALWERLTAIRAYVTSEDIDHLYADEMAAVILAILDGTTPVIDPDAGTPS